MVSENTMSKYLQIYEFKRGPTQSNNILQDLFF